MTVARQRKRHPHERVTPDVYMSHVLGSRVIAQHSGVRLCERLRARSPQCGGYRSGQVAVRASPARYGSARVYGCAVCTLGRREYPPDRSRVTLGSRPGTVVRGGRGRGCGPVCRQQPRHGPCPRGEAQVASRIAESDWLDTRCIWHEIFGLLGAPGLQAQPQTRAVSNSDDVHKPAHAAERL